MGPVSSQRTSAMPEPWADRPYELLVAGHINVDRFLTVRTFPSSDRTVPVVENRIRLGGTATNLALVATRLGVRSGLVSRIGPDFPPEFRDRLERSHIDLRSVLTVPRASTPTCYIVEDRHGRQRTLIDQGPMGSSPGPLVPPSVISEFSWLHLTTGPPDHHLALARLARRHGLRVTADPAQEIHYRWDSRRFRRLLQLSEILFGNRSEIARAVELAGVRGTTGLVERVPLVVRTEGPGGSTAFTHRARLHVPATRPRRVVSIVGAGDAFRAGFYSGWFAGRPLAECLAAGGHAAARWVEAPME
jgi:nucleoside kinase